MKKIIKMFLNEEDINEYKYYDFDYNFISNRNEETFFREYKKFLGLWNFFFYNENRLVTVFNSYEIRLKRDDIKQLIYLYQYANDNNMKKEKMILAEFLCTYYHTINTFDYKQNYDKYQDAQNEFNEILNELNFRKEFFAEFSEVVFHFYEEVINFGIENDIYIDAETIKRMFNNLSRMKKDYKELIYVFISSRKNLYDIIYFDKYLKANIEVYIEFILETLSSFERHSYIREMILEIDKTGNFNKVN